MLIDAFLPLHQTIRAATEGEYRFVAKRGPPDLTRDGNVKNPTGIAAVVATRALALGGYAKVVNFAEKIFPLNIGSAASREADSTLCSLHTLHRV